MRFKQLRLTDERVRDDEQRDVMLCLRSEQVVRVRASRKATNHEACFLFDLARSTLFDGLAKLQMAARKSPSASAMRALSLAEEYKLASHDDYADTNLRYRFTHGGCVRPNV